MRNLKTLSNLLKVKQTVTDEEFELRQSDLMLLNCGAEEDSWGPLDSKKVKLVNPKGNQSWIFIGRTDAEAEALILRSPDTMSWLIGKDPDDGEDWEKEEKGTIEDEMVGWHHRFNGHEFEHTRRQWRTGKSGVLQSMGSPRVGQDLETEFFQDFFFLIKKCWVLAIALFASVWMIKWFFFFNLLM